MAFDSTSIQSTSERMEKKLVEFAQPLKPYMPALGRFLVVATFFEDAFRIMAQWKIQRTFLEQTRRMPSSVASVYLAINVLCMLVCSTGTVTKRHVGLSVLVLATVIGTQALMYGLVFDMLYFLRNLSIMGGLLLCLSESLVRQQRTKAATIMFSLPQLSESDRHKYFQLMGRILLVLLFIGFIFNGEWGVVRVACSLVGCAACVMVVVGFRAKWSALFLVSLLSVMNVILNNWWSSHASSYRRDFAKYDFFQTLSIIGGLLLLISLGPGGLSYDERKKEF
ncbi:SURF4 family-domain-containing protein [Dichotomocladium elegans]|nr:SURF4 family-domain-containing protein [Dichotomocladium elegans]